MNKNFYQFNKEREDWVKKTEYTNDSLIVKGIKEKLFKRLKKANIELKDKRIVQLGCMEGYLIESLLEKGAYVHAVDFSQTMLHKSRIRLSNQPLKYQLSSITRDFSILSDFTFDIVLAVVMLGHLPEDMTERIIEDSKRVLVEKGGIFVFKLPLDEKHETIRGGMHPHLDINFWTAEELAKLATKYRYHAVDIDDISIFYKSKP